MAFPYRSSFGSREENYTNGTNRLGGIGGGMANTGDSKSAGLMRRFTTNALPMLSPIGQQRRQAAGDTNMVSTNVPLCIASSGMMAGGGCTGQVGEHGKGTTIGNQGSSAGIRDLIASSEPSPGRGDRSEASAGKDKTGAVGQERSQWNGTETAGLDPILSNDHVPLCRLTLSQSGLLNRTTPVSCPLVWSNHAVFVAVSYSDIAQSERKIRHIEQLLEQQRTIAAELEQIDDETRREVEQGLRHERAVSDMIAQSEPTTPPSEYQDKVPGMCYSPFMARLPSVLICCLCIRCDASVEPLLFK